MNTLPLTIALGIVMLGLGTTLTVQNFISVLRAPKAVLILIALFCQILLLPGLAFMLANLWNLPPVFAVGLVLLSASPGGSTANIFSHIFNGDVALNLSLTAINSVISAFTLPVVMGLALSTWPLPGEDNISITFTKFSEVFAIILIPVIIGMIIRASLPRVASAIEKPLKILSIIILALVIILLTIKQFDVVKQHLAQLAPICAVFGLLSMSLGYSIPYILKLSHSQSVASSMEIGIHNATLAIAIAITVLDNKVMALPSVIYGVLIYFIATGFGFLFNYLQIKNNSPIMQNK